jgi:hypothetical protein
MDNMPVGWDRPQEDEFALCLLGQPSPYTDIAFPNNPSIDSDALDLQGLTKAQQRQWRLALQRFLKMVQFRNQKRLVLKSPPHTARIPTLLALFPNAKFVHIVRNPLVVYPSTVNLWTALANKHGLQTVRHPELIEQKVCREFRIVYDRLEEAKPRISPGHFVEIRYEDLVSDTLATLARIYQVLQLGDFEAVQPRIQAFIDSNQGYETNRWSLSDSQQAHVRQQWGDIMARYGYD